MGFAEDMFGKILMVTGDLDGGYLFDPETESFTHYYYNPANPNSLSNNNYHTEYMGILQEYFGSELQPED